MRTSSIIRLSAALFLSIGSAVWFAGGAPAQTSDKGLEFLSHASSAFDSGDYGEAATYIEEAMKTGLPKDLAARATLMRGQINERNGLLARALQDYSSALWMDTLSSSDKQKAADGKERVIAAMGLNTSQPGIARQVTSSGSGSLFRKQPLQAPLGVFSVCSAAFSAHLPRRSLRLLRQSRRRPQGACLAVYSVRPPHHSLRLLRPARQSRLGRQQRLRPLP